VHKIAIAAFTSVFALAACGGTSAPAATSQAATAATPSVAAATQTSAPSAAKTNASTATTAASAAATATAASSAAMSGTARKFEVTATNSLYSMSTLEVKPGEKIEFVLTNTGDEKHNLVGVGQDVSILSPDFDAGQTVSWIWTAPTKLGTFQLRCSYHTAIPPITVTVK